jgi:putative copper resistance protein D
VAGAETGLRLVQYLAVLVLFGLTALPIRAGALRPLRTMLAILAFAASLASLGWLAWSLTGSFPGVADVVTATGAGMAAVVRLMVLTLAIRPFRTGRIAALLTGIAAVTLAWGGHAAAGEGSEGLLRLAADGVHLLAAGLWLGALAGFAIAAWRGPDPAEIQAMAHFSNLGTVLVGLLAATGLAGLLWNSGGQALAALSSAWGQLLVAKLGLVGLMLVLAALNRWRLVPALSAEAGSRAVARLRLSLTAEMSLGVLVLLLVSLLGVLPPTGAE